MKFPSIGDYLSSVVSGSDFFSTISDVEPVLGLDGEPIFYSGNFGVVFKVTIGGRVRAIKCFTSWGEGRGDAYDKICLGMPFSPYIVSHRYLRGEVFAGAIGEPLVAYDLLEMDFVEGVSLMADIEFCCKVGDVGRLELLSRKFDEMALWLLGQDFAHGDIKPDNIVVMSDGSLRLVDYDGIYMPTMKGQSQRECGTVGFQHPLRCDMIFGKSIDNYSLSVTSLTLRALSFDYTLLSRFAHKDGAGLLFNPSCAIDGSSNFIAFLKSTPLRELDLIRCVTSKEPDCAGVKDALLQTLDFDKQALLQSLTPVKCDAKFGYLDGLGGERLVALYDAVEPFCSGFAAVRRGDFWGYIDNSGECRTEFIYQNGWSFDCNGFAMVKLDGKYGFLNLDFKLVIAARFDYAAPFSEGLAVAAVDGKYGYIDYNGAWVVEPIYDYAERFHGGSARVELGGAPSEIRHPNHAQIVELEDGVAVD